METMVTEAQDTGSGQLPSRSTASAVAHHGELIQGVFEDEDGRLHRALVTLPLAGIRSQATFYPTEGADLTVQPLSKHKAAKAARLTLEHLGISQPLGRLSIESSIPVGHGFGSSTADVVASIGAVSAAFGVELRRSSISRLAVAAERASDAIAYEDHVVLFAHREGVVLEDFGGSLPPLLVVGFKANGGLPIDTLALPPARYGSEEIQQFAVIRGMVAYAIRFQDPRLLGQAASASARISQRHLPKANYEIAVDIAHRAQACGVQVAHSGSLIGLLFDLAAKDLVRKTATAAEAAAEAGFNDIGVHRIHDEGARWRF